MSLQIDTYKSYLYGICCQSSSTILFTVLGSYLIIILLLLLLLLLLNLYSARYMLTPRGALHYKVKMYQCAAKRFYTLP